MTCARLDGRDGRCLHAGYTHALIHDRRCYFTTRGGSRPGRFTSLSSTHTHLVPLATQRLIHTHLARSRPQTRSTRSIDLSHACMHACYTHASSSSFSRRFAAHGHGSRRRPITHSLERCRL